MIFRSALATLLIGTASPALAQDVMDKPSTLTASGMPDIPAEIYDDARGYLEGRSAGFRGWDPKDGSMLISTRFGNVSQIHRVTMPLGMRQQITFESEPVGASLSPDGETMIVSKDAGGSEFNQLYLYDNARLTLLTDGESRNGMGPWMEDSSAFAFGSTKRNGRESDIYLMNPANPSSARMIFEAPTVGYYAAAFSPDGSKLVIGHYTSVQKNDYYLLDLASGEVAPIGDPSRVISQMGAGFDNDGNLWVTSDEGSDFKRLGMLDLATGAFTTVGDFGDWDVSGFVISDDGSMMAIETSEAGLSKLYLRDMASGTIRPVTTLPPGVVGGFDFSPDNTLGMTLTSNKGTDAYALDTDTLELTRWTKSESGGIDLDRNADPEIVSIESFDGERVTGLLYRPDPSKFPGPRPLIIDIHGGPEGQTAATSRGTDNYYVNELGYARFYPNVRGSTGFGKRFVSLDNGPFLRENSVKDIGAFLDHFASDAAIDSDRIGVTGGSYGGYMCYATAIHYPDKVNGAVCNVAISSFVTFLENTQDYRRDLRRAEYGDERDPEQRAKLVEISPMTRITEISDPLFVIQGANDPRVPKSEADQLVAKVREAGQDVWYLVGENEGHGFAKKDNRDYQIAAEILFWSQVMGENN
ncbi:S9 family peptidase [Sphingomicrobium clamense]|uniref:Prolyl oligopeptidase family serine peptidase n=1 Tax=Sphingomicrobium clamense TaxID=2851013 RepID=A0ABS6V8E5_9SPHN|nr:prolyl oligopeptidase family serine peptidase [Sphingomicrobium sp. B8]MBW0145843.1 prolyl oligopeptidase family serine peptidase [Sphingomicrobium sp. B8]